MCVQMIKKNNNNNNAPAYEIVFDVTYHMDVNLRSLNTVLII